MTDQTSNEHHLSDTARQRAIEAYDSARDRPPAPGARPPAR